MNAQIADSGTSDVDSDEFDNFCKLAELAERSFVTRREYEWKIILGFWAVSFGAFFGATKADIGPIDGRLLIGVVVGFWVLWIRGIWIANQNDKRRYEYYLSKAENRIQIKRSPTRSCGFCSWVKGLWCPLCCCTKAPDEYPQKISKWSIYWFIRGMWGDWNTQFQLLVTICIALLISYKGSPQNELKNAVPGSSSAQSATDVPDAQPMTKDSSSLPAGGSKP